MLATAGKKIIFCRRGFFECEKKDIKLQISQILKRALTFLSFRYHSKSLGLAFFIEKNHICPVIKHTRLTLSNIITAKSCKHYHFREGYFQILKNITNPSSKFLKTAKHKLVMYLDRSFWTRSRFSFSNAFMSV